MDTTTTTAPAPRRTRRALLAGLALAGAGAGALSLATSAEAAATPRYATVRGDGALLRGSGVSSVQRVSPGQYEVTFTAPTTSCAMLASTRSTTTEALTVFTAGGHKSQNGAFVEVKNQGGGLQDGTFSLNLLCGSSGTQHAVVGYDGQLVRSSGAGLTKLSAGRYELAFPASVSRCALLATVGDPGGGVVYHPSNVSTALGSTTNAIVVETKNPGGGLQDGIPFHVGAICPDTGNGSVVVVRADGLPNRSSARTSSFRTATGSYVAALPASASSCAVITTRGDVGTAAPYAPATIESASGPASNTVGFRVRNLAHFGGAPADQSFHAAVTC